MSVKIVLGVREVKALIGDNEELRAEITKGAISNLMSGLANMVRESFSSYVNLRVRDEIATLTNSYLNGSFRREASGAATSISSGFREQVKANALAEIDGQIAEVRLQVAARTAELRKQIETLAQEKMHAMESRIERLVEMRVNEAIETEVNRRVAEKMSQALTMLTKG